MNVPPGEKLTRFIRFNRHFSNTTNRVKHDAFLPRKDQTDLSAFRISGILDSEVWEIGREHVAQEGEPIKARADFLAGAVYEIDLEVIADGQGHKRHVSIRPFPIETNLDDRKKRRDIARKLALVSNLEIPPAEMR